MSVETLLKDLQWGELGDELGERGLDRKGTKAVLQKRLAEFLQEAGEDPEQFRFVPGLLREVRDKFISVFVRGQVNDQVRRLSLNPGVTETMLKPKVKLNQERIHRRIKDYHPEYGSILNIRHLFGCDSDVKLNLEPINRRIKDYHPEYGPLINIRQLFDCDSDRFEKFSLKIGTPEDGSILLDYSEYKIDGGVLKALPELASARKVKETRDVMLKGEKINVTENRSVLHIALRNRSSTPNMVDAYDVMQDVDEVVAHINCFCDEVRMKWVGYTAGKTIIDFVDIEIGGSDFGPLMATEALKPYAKGFQVHFVGDIDGSHTAETPRELNGETALLNVASGTYTTQEAITNAMTAELWSLDGAEDPEFVAKRFVTLSTNRPKVKELGIKERNTFDLWDWVGGCYPLWSAC